MRLLEHYTSIQGEGPNVGKPIQFVRFAGCNMRCPGWPCDTPQAIFPEQWREEADTVRPADLYRRLDPWPAHICVTGGEPFLQTDLQTFLSIATGEGYKVDIFTNGSRKILLWVARSTRIDIIMDWKLRGSGEADKWLEQRWANAVLLERQNHIKFVVKDKDDLDEARELTSQFAEKGVRCQLWVGGAWDRIEDAEIVEYIREYQLPWRLNVQLHKHIWEPTARYT